MLPPRKRPNLLKAKCPEDETDAARARSGDGATAQRDAGRDQNRAEGRLAYGHHKDSTPTHGLRGQPRSPLATPPDQKSPVSRNQLSSLELGRLGWG
jgi:hypothetical protein